MDSFIDHLVDLFDDDDDKKDEAQEDDENDEQDDDDKEDLGSWRPSYPVFVMETTQFTNTEDPAGIAVQVQPAGENDTKDNA